MGCGVPGIMATRTIENEKDRRMTIILTTNMPCGAKIPIIAVLAFAFFPEDTGLVTTSAYFIGLASIIVSGIILKKSSLFAGDPGSLRDGTPRLSHADGFQCQPPGNRTMQGVRSKGRYGHLFCLRPHLVPSEP